MPAVVKFNLRHPIESLSLIAAERRGLQRAGKIARIATPFAVSGVLVSAFLALTGHPQGMDVMANILIGLGAGEVAARFIRNSFRLVRLEGINTRNSLEIADLKGKRTELLAEHEKLLGEHERISQELGDLKERFESQFLQLEYQNESIKYRIRSKIPMLSRIQRMVDRAATDLRGLTNAVREKGTPQSVLNRLFREAEKEVEIFKWQLQGIKDEIADLEVVAARVQQLKAQGQPLPPDGLISADNSPSRPRKWQGGMGEAEVFYNLHADVFVIRKSLLPHLAKNKELVARFIREAQIVSMFDHPNIARGYGYSGENEGEMLSYSTEYVRGRTLAELLNVNPDDPQSGTPLPPVTATIVGMQILSAIEYMGNYQYRTGDKQVRTGIVHRDLKPENVIIAQDRSPSDPDYVKVIDLGLAREEVAQVKQTMTGSTLGTPPYMAPEQLRGDKVLTSKVDIYALGAILYEMYTGKMLFSAYERPDVTGKIMTSKYIPTGIREMMIRMVAILPKDRPTHAEIRNAFEQFLSSSEGTRVG